MMSEGISRTVAILVCAVALVLGILIYRVTVVSKQVSPEQLYGMGTILREQISLVDPFSLKDHNGEIFNNDRFQGKWSLIFFGFTFCPDICPTTLAKLDKLKGSLEVENHAEDLQVIMVSVDPARDNPQRLKDYVQYFDTEFIGVTGEVEPLFKFATSLSSIFAKVPLDEDGGYTMDHSTNVIVVNPSGEYMAVLRPPFQLADMKASLLALMERNG